MVCTVVVMVVTAHMEADVIAGGSGVMSDSGVPVAYGTARVKDNDADILDVFGWKGNGHSQVSAINWTLPHSLVWG